MVEVARRNLVSLITVAADGTYLAYGLRRFTRRVTFKAAQSRW
ncbi:MAG: hypothetical protein ACJ71E_05440 [Nitrososphaeraceae archaeon]|jgi:hypothetical protein